jgi:hypothetical protein
MKTTFLCAAAAAAVLLVSAAVWEGVTNVAAAKDLPEAYGIATNSFPRNTVVDITNLENGKMVRVIVISGLETTGLLATLSRNAADALDLRHDSTCRIRMTQPSDNASQQARAGNPPSLLQLGPIGASGTPVLAAENATAANRAPATETAPMASRTTITETVTTTTRTTTTESIPIANNARTNVPATESATPASKPPATESVIAADEQSAADDVIAADESPATDNVIAADEPVLTDNIIAMGESTVADNAAVNEPTVTNNVVSAGNPAGAGTETRPEPRIASGTLALIPAEERPPSAQEQPAAARDVASRYVTPNVASNDTAASRNVTPNVASADTAVSRNTAPRDVVSGDAAPRNIAPRDVVSKDAPLPVSQPVETPAAYIPPADFSPFQAPLISSLEQGKWYVQLGVYSRPDNVEEEINRIGTAYPVAVQNVGTDTSPMFRVLLGPLNQGESGAMLQRFKSIGYADAFVRHN